MPKHLRDAVTNIVFDVVEKKHSMDFCLLVFLCVLGLADLWERAHCRRRHASSPP